MKPRKSSKKYSKEKYKWVKVQLEEIDSSNTSPRLKDRKKKFHKQFKEQGWTDMDTWSLDSAIARFILPRLKRFKELTIGVPNGFNDIAEWYAVLDQMILAFELMLAIDKPNYDFKNSKKDNVKIKRGLNLFVKYYLALWW